MEIERRTGSYNVRRYSKPWIAKVDFGRNPNGEFLWGNWVGQAGEEGILIIAAEPGDIIARGQKDFRKPKNSAPDWYQVDDAGTLIALDSKAEAYKKFKH